MDRTTFPPCKLAKWFASCCHLMCIEFNMILYVFLSYAFCPKKRKNDQMRQAIQDLKKYMRIL